MKTLWTKVKRNPVLNAFAVAIAAQVARDYIADQIDWTNIVQYISEVFIAVAARTFTVPLKEVDERLGGDRL